MRDWPPEQIAGRLRREGAQHRVSPASIYRFIYWRGGRGLKLSRRQAKRGLRSFEAKRNTLPHELAIANRPGNKVLCPLHPQQQTSA